MKINATLRAVLGIAALMALGTLSLAAIPASAGGPWYVATTGNDTNNCLSPSSPCASINGAINKASAGDTIFVAIGTYTGTGDEVVLLNKHMTLSGGWDVAFAVQSETSIIDGEDSRRGINVNSGVTTIFERFTVQNGFSSEGGGGVFNQGVLTLNDTIISGNEANGGPFAAVGGGGISNHGTVTLNNSTVSDNTADGGGGGIGNFRDVRLNFDGTVILNNSAVTGNASNEGGGINANGILNISNSTVSGNTANQGIGGGIFVWDNGTVTVTLSNSTVSDNIAAEGGGIHTVDSPFVTVSLQNTILAENTSGISPDCKGVISSMGYNLIGDISGCDFTPATGDLTNIDPLLGPLQDNGGPTDTHALLAGSRAIDAGNPAACTDQDGNLLMTDQRGIVRPQGAVCDIGAFELEATPPSIHVSSNTGGNAGGVAFRDEDILAFDPGSGTWSMVFDGSDVGVGSEDLIGFLLLNDGSILLTFNDPFSLSGIGTVDDSDIVQFFPTSLGSNTAGSFSLFLDGSDVGLSSAGEDIDAIGAAPDGRLVISTRGSFDVSGASGRDEDLLVFNATSFGSSTSGSWQLYFDGSDVGLTNSGEDVAGTWIDPVTGEIYLTTQESFSVTGASGDNSDIFICDSGSLGSSTSCTFSPFWDGSANGFGGERTDGISIGSDANIDVPGVGPTPTNTPVPPTPTNTPVGPTPPPSNGSISGTVMEQGTGTPIAGLEVSACVFDPDDPCFNDFTEADGSYTICCIPPGDYRLASGGQDNWAVESYNEQPEYFSGERVPVVAGVDLVGFNFTLVKGGSISGTVSEQGTGTPIAGLEVSACVFDPDDPCFSDFTEADGSYTICCIPPGDYRLASGGEDGWAVEYHNEQTDFGSANPVTVVASVDLVGINFTLVMTP